MTVTKARIEAEGWSRANLTGFAVTGDLFGREQVFSHGGRTVIVRIPSVSVGSNLAPLEASRGVAALYSRQIDNPTPATTSYLVNWIEISVWVKEQITAPAELMELSPKRPEIAGARLTNRLDELSIEYEKRISSALDHWEGVVRWISGSSSLGSPEAVVGRGSAHRLSFTCLRERENKHRFWLPTQVMSIPGRTTIDEVKWRAIGAALSAGHEAPMWIRYLDEAHHRYVGWDFSGAVLSCAIACETLAREGLWLVSGATTQDAARDLIDRVSVRGILGRWTALTGIPKAQARIGELDRLFSLRNRLMHAGGKGAELDQARIRDLLSATRSFVRTGDEWYYHMQGLDNPRL